jgi:phosphocarrier protein FPr/phosphocarrier protein
MANLTLVSPLRGWCAPLDETPDAVFAQRLLGDGVAIDPTAGVLHAPCDGEVISVAAAGHAIALRAGNGAEILLHVGIDTVALGGAGFTVLVKVGARVRQGDPLLNFDLDVLARRAKSLITPIVITNGEQFSIANARSGCAVDVGDALLELRPATTAVKASSSEPAPQEVTQRVTIAHDHGIHARPAALIANFAKTAAADITVVARERKANAKSAVALMSLGAQRGDELTLVASGAGAREAVAEL